MLVITSLLLTALLSAPALAQSNVKTALFPSPGLSVLNDDIASHAPVRHGTITRRWGSTAPQNCINVALERTSDSNPAPKCRPQDLSVWTATFSDCSQGWTFCRCNDAAVGEQQMMDLFGQLPVGLRSAVRNIMAFKGEGAGAQAPLNDFVLYGPVDIANPTVLLHESSHDLDFGRKQNGFPDYGYSNDPAFISAVHTDTCVADDYAKANAETDTQIDRREVWAQAFVLRRYQQQVGPLPRDASCMSNQLNVIGQQTDALLSVTTCNLSTKVPPDVEVTKPNVSKRLRRALRQRDTTPVSKIEWLTSPTGSFVVDSE